MLFEECHHAVDYVWLRFVIIVSNANKLQNGMTMSGMNATNIGNIIVVTIRQMGKR